MLEKNSKISAADYSPIITFVLGYFLIHLLDFQEATNFVIAALFSLVAYMVEIHFVKEEYSLSKEGLGKTSYYTGILTFSFLVIFVIGILNWFRLVSASLRMGAILVAMTIYMVIMFRAIHILIDVKLNSKKKK